MPNPSRKDVPTRSSLTGFEMLKCRGETFWGRLTALDSGYYEMLCAEKFARLFLLNATVHRVTDGDDFTIKRIHQDDLGSVHVLLSPPPRRPRA